MGIIAMETIRTLEQYKPDQSIEILHWTTNLTFETIGRTGFGYDFHLLGSIDDAKVHPFIEAMGYCLQQTIIRSQQAEIFKKLPTEQNRRFDRSIKLMNSIVEEVIVDRKNSPEATNMDKDLLGFMLNARDEHGLGLSDENIRDQVITFLIAGHDVSNSYLYIFFRKWHYYYYYFKRSVLINCYIIVAFISRLLLIHLLGYYMSLPDILTLNRRCYKKLRILALTIPRSQPSSKSVN